MAPDPAAYEGAFIDLQPACTRLARTILGDPDAAQEVAGEALTRLYEHWHDVGDDAGHYTGWTLRVTRNLAVDRLRRRARDAHMPDADEPAHAGAAMKTADMASEIVLRLALDDALAALPTRQKDAVTLRYLVELPQADVAAMLGIAPGTVGMHLHRALASLRAALAEPPTAQPTALAPNALDSRKASATMPSTDPHGASNPTDSAALAHPGDEHEAAALIGTGRLVHACIVEPVPGGYLADIGFPAVFRGRGNWKHERQHVDLTGQQLDVEVVDIDADGRVVVSAPIAAADADGFARAQRTVRGMQPGQRRRGVVRSVLPFGAFVIVDGVDGLVHASELRPGEHLEAGQSVDVEVLATDVPLVRASFRPAH